jgi:uncharacterized Tic20 family protein
MKAMIIIGVFGTFALGFACIAIGDVCRFNAIVGLGVVILALPWLLGVLDVWWSGHFQSNWGVVTRDRQPIRFYISAIIFSIVIVVLACLGVAGMCGWLDVLAK